MRQTTSGPERSNHLKQMTRGKGEQAAPTGPRSPLPAGIQHNSNHGSRRHDRNSMLTARTILKRTLLILRTCLTRRRIFITSSLRVLTTSLVALLAFVSCVRLHPVADNQARPIVYVAVGDSTGIGLGARNGGGYVDRLFARIEQKRSGSTLINLCTAGATTADVVNKQVARLGDTRATLVTVCVGVNDLLRGGEEKKFAENYDALVTELRQSSLLVVVANLPDITSAPAMKGVTGESLRSRLKQFNKAIEEVARRQGVPMVDLYKLSGETIRSRPELFSSDGLHPSDLGYAQWSEAMWAVLEESGGLSLMLSA
jgi:acyl-CoA thioesterase I